MVEHHGDREGYVPLFDLYECAINPHLLEQKILDGEELLSTHFFLVGIETLEDENTLPDR